MDDITPTSGDTRRSHISPAVRRLVGLLDDRFTIPGTGIRFGLDAVIGLVPGIGDFLGMLIGGAVIYEAIRQRVEKRIVVRMLVNLGLDAALGSVPLVGDAFDVYFKVHRRNLELLEEALGA